MARLSHSAAPENIRMVDVNAADTTLPAFRKEAPTGKVVPRNGHVSPHEFSLGLLTEAVVKRAVASAPVGSSLSRPTGPMHPVIGFVIVTFSQPTQLLHLCRRLGEMFGDPPIAVHHDFSQCDLDVTQFPSCVSFVRQWVRTGWGSMSVVDAQLAAMRLLCEKANPEWCINLSGSDYPIQTRERILEVLHGANVDAFFNLRAVEDRGERFVNAGLGELAFDHPRYSQSAFNRYVAIQLLSPKLAHNLKQPCEAWVLRSKYLIRRLTPFGGSLRCFGGDGWFTANRRVMRLFMEQTPLWQQLYEHYKTRSLPEESFFHTLLGNSPGYQLSDNNLRYADWRGCYAHPRVLGREDFPRLLSSSKHFARKFPFDPVLLAELDRAVAAKTRNGVQHRQISGQDSPGMLARCAP